MATISIDYDSNGDVELILEDSLSTGLTQRAEQDSQSAMYTVGPLGIKVKDVHLKVSSLRLTSSSKFFRAMLEGSAFPEGRQLQEHGLVQLRLSEPEDDPRAMIIILGILYENDVQVPTEIDFPTLCKVAVLVDKYYWHIPVTPYATSWFDQLLKSHGFPDSFDQKILDWLWIAWLFGMKDHFKKISRVAQQDACTSTDLMDEGIRLPTRIIEAINKQRQVAFQQIEQAIEAFQVHILHNMQNGEGEYASPEHRMLGCMAIGFATSWNQNLKVGNFAAPDHAGSSVRLLIEQIKQSQTMEGWTVQAPNEGASRFIIPGGKFDLKAELQKTIIDLKMDDWGLNYDDFKQSPAAKQSGKASNLE
ncbi:hypothetical protein N431DRAFT_445613 [Stipitochalara longipes BDJ]|nr:hypothetical protein N431DRAFT_445613 [Stipitochalara longipes BDJ]